MNIQNNNETQSSDRVKPDDEFEWFPAIIGFVLGLVISGLVLTGMAYLTFGYGFSGDVTPDWAHVVTILGIIVAIVVPFVSGYWFGNAGGAKSIKPLDQASRQPCPDCSGTGRSEPLSTAKFEEYCGACNGIGSTQN